jgi:hypothetical protein
MQIMSIQSGVFECAYIVLKCHYIQTYTMFAQLLQLDVMHNFCKIASGHVGESTLLGGGQKMLSFCIVF